LLTDPNDEATKYKRENQYEQPGKGLLQLQIGVDVEHPPVEYTKPNPTDRKYGKALVLGHLFPET
jgi:hypothetical protein